MCDACLMIILLPTHLNSDFSASNQNVWNSVSYVWIWYTSDLYMYTFSDKKCSFLFALQAVLSALSWRWLLALSSLPCFLLLLFFRITPESPRYLCAQNRMTDARFVLERMAIANQAALPMGVLTYHQETKTECITHVSEDEHLIPVREKEHTVRNAISSKSGAGAVLHKLLSHNLLKSTLLLWFVYFASSFAYYGITLLTSQLSDVNRSCKSDLVFEVHQNNGNLYKDTFITSLAGRLQ